MSLAKRAKQLRLKYHPHAYLFVSEALKLAQEQLGRDHDAEAGEEGAHISGRELLEGVRLLGSRHFGMMAPSVFSHWGVRATDDFGEIVFELVERGQMRKTDRDQLSDFYEVYDFRDVFGDDYAIDTSKAFRE